ncbi:MAG: hypothetical protein GSR80_001001 [Desulfurococcales archaeon]|nr:hypothetical protein [Desulfurococcales archaeon]
MGGARREALRKRPSVEPLIVRTGYYVGSLGEREIQGVAVNAPFGSGKTFGIALKSYHDSRLGVHPVDGTRVVVLRARELVGRDEYFDRLARDSRNIMCGGLLLSALNYASRRYERCTAEGDASCYTTLTRGEAEGIAALLDDTGLAGGLGRGVGVEALAEFLRRAQKDVLRGANIAVVIDEVEGFLSELHLRAGDVVYSNLVAMSKLHDQGVWGVKLVMLIQSRVIGGEWDEMIARIREGRPYVSEELRGVIEVAGESSIYPCPSTGERIDVSALMGRVKLTAMTYYRGDVYVDYARQALRRIAALKGKLDRRIVEAAEDYAAQLSDYYVGEEASRRLAFLEAIAPRIAFDYMDELIEDMLLSGKSDVREALDIALHRVAEEWSRYDDIRKFYSKLVIKRIPGHRKLYKGSILSPYKMLTPRDYNAIVKGLARDLYAELVRDTAGTTCVSEPRSARYHSNYIAVVSCPLQGGMLSGVLVLRATASKPSKTQSTEKLASQLARYMRSLIESTTPQTTRRQGKNDRYHDVIGVMLVPEETPSTLYLRLESAFDNALRSLKPALKGLARRPPITVVHQIRDEDFIIIAEKIAGRSHSLSLIDQFVEERYKDVVAELAGRVKPRMHGGA